MHDAEDKLGLPKLPELPKIGKIEPMKTVITAAHLVTPEEWIDSPVVVIEDGQIAAVAGRAALQIPAEARHIDFPGLILAPGLIDIHIHGGAGHDVMETNGAALAAIEGLMVKHGVTSYLPTTVTAREDAILSALAHLGKAVRAPRAQKRARPLGIHLEGPFISHAKRGVHPSENLQQPSPEALDRFWQAAQGAIRMMTIAPELPGALETIRYGRKLGIRASLGHSNATQEEARAGVTAGANHATHTFNAMRPLDHRDPGILGAVLLDDALTADIIADGIHVDPSVVGLFLRAKGEERAILITDAISATGMPEGQYRLGPFVVEVKDGRCDYQGKLAGSVLTLDRAVRNVMSFAGWKLQQAVKLATLNPARLLKIDDQLGMLAPGRVADLVALTPDGCVQQTLVAGEVVSI
jgi:N-acetylglucosamine-6-phosphate deacetylase